MDVNKLWARVAAVFLAPATMTNRSSKMQQLWNDYRFNELAGAAPEAAGIEQPARSKCAGQKKRLTHSVLEQWPACLVEEGAERRPRGQPQRRKANASALPALSAAVSTGARRQHHVWAHSLDPASTRGIAGLKRARIRAALHHLLCAECACCACRVWRAAGKAGQKKQRASSEQAAIRGEQRRGACFGKPRGDWLGRSTALA